MKAFSSVLLSSLLLAMPASASWWIEPDDLALRYDIQLLADAGLIKQPVNTFPLMWRGIIDDLQQVDGASLPLAQQDALQRVLTIWQRDKRPQQYSLAAAGETEQPAFVRYGDTLRDKAQLQASGKLVGEHFSGRLSVSQVSQPYDRNQTRLDGSYLATRWGNWIVSAGAIEKYWGPSFDTSTIMSTNGRPIPAISLTRDSSSAAADDWLPPWTFTTSFGQLSSRLEIPDAKLWQARFGIRPLSSLELGFSWVMQYGGEGYGNGLKDWYDGLFQGATEEGTENMLAGYDLRWSNSLFGVPFGIYITATADDFNNDKLKMLKVAYQAGVDWHVSALNSRMYMDWVNTTVNCTDNVYQNCFYEHSLHTDGYRRYGRAIGTSYDNDSRAFNIGIHTQLDSQTSWHNKLAWLQLNLDGTRVNLPSQWTQTQLPARTVLLWRTEQQWREETDQWKWGLELSNTEDKASGSRDWQTELFLQWRRDF